MHHPKIEMLISFKAPNKGLSATSKASQKGMVFVRSGFSGSLFPLHKLVMG